MILSSLTTENWIALLAILFVVFAAIGLTFRHRHQDRIRQYNELENAYRAQEKEMSQRTQTLRAANNELYYEISQHKITEIKLRQAQAYLNSIIDSLPSILISVTADGVITHWNTRAEEITGCKEEAALGRYLWDIYPLLPVDLAMIRDAIANKAPHIKECCKQIVAGTTHYLDIAVFPLHSNIESLNAETIIQVDDVTVRVMMENMIIQNEKMMSLGELAAGLAHEINNPLGAILQSVQNIERRTSTGLAKNRMVAEEAGASIESLETYLEKRDIKKFLHNIKEAGERSARIVENMLGFAHKNQNHSAININELAQNCLELSENNFRVKMGPHRKNIKIKTHFDKTLPAIKCSPAEIQQVLLNLLRNASQCFVNQPASRQPIKEPTITITTLQKNGLLQIKVRDNGPGIPEQVRRHMFEPFYTTKEVGQGTGLGLSISYFIITEHHHGSIDVESAPGEGTEFTVSLPLTDHKQTDHKLTATPSGEAHGNI